VSERVKNGDSEGEEGLNPRSPIIASQTPTQGAWPQQLGDIRGGRARAAPGAVRPHQ